MSNLIKCIDLARAEKIDSYPVLTDCRAEIERLTAVLDKMQLANIKKAERIAKLEAAIALHVKQFPPYAEHTLGLRNAIAEVNDDG